MRSRVAQAERKVEQWKARNNIFDSEGQILSEKQLARLMEQSVNARNATTEAKAKYEQTLKLARMGDNGTALAEVLKSPTIQLLNMKRLPRPGNPQNWRRATAPSIRRCSRSAPKLQKHARNSMARSRGWLRTSRTNTKWPTRMSAILPRPSLEYEGAAGRHQGCRRGVEGTGARGRKTKQIFEALLAHSSRRAARRTSSFPMPISWRRPIFPFIPPRPSASRSCSWPSLRDLFWAWA